MLKKMNFLTLKTIWLSISLKKPFSSKSKYHWIFKNLLNNKYQLYVSNEVLLEYEEIISRRFSEEVAFTDL